MRLLYQLINIHQRTKTDIKQTQRFESISLSISIREPKPYGGLVHNTWVSAYQYPSENQNGSVANTTESSVSAYQYPSENQNEAEKPCPGNAVSAYQYPSENQNPRVVIDAFGKVSAYQYPSENQNPLAARG